MFCARCQNDLVECTCEDREERFQKLQQCQHLHIGDDYKARIQENIDRSKSEQSKQE
jgi:hypothetical protein